MSLQLRHHPLVSQVYILPRHPTVPTVGRLQTPFPNPTMGQGPSLLLNILSQDTCPSRPPGLLSSHSLPHHIATLLFLAPTPPAWAVLCTFDDSGGTVLGVYTPSVRIPKASSLRIIPKENCSGLNLNNKNISSLPAGIFSGLNNLGRLRLRGNSLTCLLSLPSSIYNDIDNHGLPSCGEEPEEEEEKIYEENPNQEMCNCPPWPQGPSRIRPSSRGQAV